MLDFASFYHYLLFRHLLTVNIRSFYVISFLILHLIFTNHFLSFIQIYFSLFIHICGDTFQTIVDKATDQISLLFFPSVHIHVRICRCYPFRSNKESDSSEISSSSSGTRYFEDLLLRCIIFITIQS